MSERLTSARAVRAAFWRDHPNLPRKRITNYAGNGTMYVTDTRCAFADYVDALAKENRISQRLAMTVTLRD